MVKIAPLALGAIVSSYLTDFDQTNRENYWPILCKETPLNSAVIEELIGTFTGYCCQWIPLGVSGFLMELLAVHRYPNLLGVRRP